MHRRCDGHPNDDVDFSDENDIARFVRPRDLLALDVGKFKLLPIDVRLFSSRTSQSQRTRILDYFAYGCGVQIRSHVPPRLASRPRERAGKKETTSPRIVTSRTRPVNDPQQRDHDPNQTPLFFLRKNAADGPHRPRHRAFLGLRHRGSERRPRQHRQETNRCEDTRVGGQAARAEVIKQREAAAAYAATLHAAHAEALAVLNESRREDAAAAEKCFAEAVEAHAAEVDLIRTCASREKRRLSWAFSASKALLAENNAAIQADHARMKKRFDNRDSRDDDVEKLAELTAEVRALDRVNAHLRGETEAFSRELDNRDQNDSIFGGCGSMRSSPGQGARKTTGGRSPMRSTGGRTPPSTGVSSPLSTTSPSLERAKSFP